MGAGVAESPLREPDGVSWLMMVVGNALILKWSARAAEALLGACWQVPRVSELLTMHTGVMLVVDAAALHHH